MKKILLNSFLLVFIQLHSFGQERSWDESVFVHLSKNIASTEEPIWMLINVKTTVEDFYPSTAYVELVNRNGQSLYQLLVPLREGKAEVQIKAPASLISDHYLLRCYTRSSVYSGEEGIFNQLLTIINPEKPAPSISTSSTIADFTLSSPNRISLLTTQSITKEERGRIEIPHAGIVSVSLENPFLEEKYQGRLSIKIYNSLQPNEVLPEPYGHIVHARIRGESNHQAYYLSAHGKQNYFNIAQPNTNGEMFFELASFRDLQFLLIQKDDESSAMDFELISPFFPFSFAEGFNFPKLELQREDEAFLTNLITAGQVEDYYYKPQFMKRQSINTEIKPDKTYVLDDYNRFENVEITLKEYIPEVYVRKNNRSTLFKVMNSPTGIVFEKNPLLLIDNMPVVNADIFAAFDPKGIAKIDLITREFYFNDQVYSGVISLTSKSGDFGGFDLPKDALYLDYYKFALQLDPIDQHVNPKLEDKDFPDFRNLLHWNSQVEKGSSWIVPSRFSGNYQVKFSYFDGENWKTSFDKLEIRD